MSLPLWIYAVFAGIIFSAIMTIKASKEDRDVDQEFIEKEGEKYMKRIESDRQKRKKSAS